MHSNLAHPSQADFVRFLINAKASLRTLVGAKGLRCSVCERNVKPKQPRPTAMPTIGRFNSTVQGDIFYVHLVTAAEVGVYGNICCSTLLHKADVSVNDTAVELFNSLNRSWLAPFGPPDEYVCDAQPGFTSEYFSDKLSQLGIHMRIIPAEAHWQLGRIERHNYTTKIMIQKLIDELQVTTLDELTVVITQVFAAKNS
jgi:hypothetical protein